MYIHIYKGHGSISRDWWKILDTQDWKNQVRFPYSTTFSVTQLCHVSGTTFLSSTLCTLHRQPIASAWGGVEVWSYSSYPATHPTPSYPGFVSESQLPNSCLCIGDHFHKRRKSWEPDRPLSALQFQVRWQKRRGLANKVNVLKPKGRYSTAKEQHLCPLHTLEKFGGNYKIL